MVWMVAGAATVAAIGTALLGHSVTGSTVSPTRVVPDALHVLAAGIWVGFLVVSLTVLVPNLRRGGEDTSSAREVLRGFAPTAMLCVAVMAVTGVYLASEVVGSVDAALVTVYGRVLLLKVLIVVVSAVLGFVNSRRVHQDAFAIAWWKPQASTRHARTGLWLTVGVEGGLGIAVLGLPAVLSSSQPAVEPQLITAAAPSTVPIVHDLAGDLEETLTVRPNLPGRNVAVIGVFDTRRPSLGRVTGVDITTVTPAVSLPFAAPRPSRTASGRST